MRAPAESWLTDMDGVLVREEHALPGSAEFLARLVEQDRPFLVLTNNSIFTPRDLSARLKRSGLTVPEASIWTSALATASFLDDQLSGGAAYVIGEAGLTTALHEVGYTLTDLEPDFVVLGETRTYSFTAITKAIRLILGGARFIATNPDVTDVVTQPGDDSQQCRAVAAVDDREPARRDRGAHFRVEGVGHGQQRPFVDQGCRRSAHRVSRGQTEVVVADHVMMLEGVEQPGLA